MNELDIPNLTLNNIDYGENPFFYTADVQATSIFHCHFNPIFTF